jgi:hypothetical protein
MNANKGLITLAVYERLESGADAQIPPRVRLAAYARTKGSESTHVKG